MKWMSVAILSFAMNTAAFANIETTEVGVAPQLSVEEVSTISYQTPENDYSSNLKLREEKKVGAGIGLGGDLGLYGAQVELNFDSENAARLGFAVGTEVQSFSLQWKRSFEGEYFAPYFSAGIARWFNSAETNLTNKSYVLNAVLDEKAKNTGIFTADFFVGSAGMQYYQLDGDWKGAGFYFEFSLLASINRSILIPSGGLGVLYYF